MKHFQWQSLSLMTHSFSSMRSFYYLGLNSHRVDLWIALDNLEPYEFQVLPTISGAYETYLRTIDDKADRLEQEPPCYTYEKLLGKIEKGSMGSMSKEFAPNVITRGVAPSKKHPGKWYFSYDPTMKSLREGCHAENAKIVAREIKCPVLFMMGLQSHIIKLYRYEPGRKFLEYFKKINPQLEVRFLEGKHHFFVTEAEKSAEYIEPFLKKYYKAEVVRNKL